MEVIVEQTFANAKEPAIELKNLTKRFGKLTAVDGIDLGIKYGEIFGLLGPNGAGKTTTVNMLSTLLDPTDGSATVAGFDVVENASEVRKVMTSTDAPATIVVGWYDVSAQSWHSFMIHLSLCLMSLL
jgi:ABC-type multidrug transport system ATPase subunit